jgi:hypothetical protein
MGYIRIISVRDARHRCCTGLFLQFYLFFDPHRYILARSSFSVVLFAAGREMRKRTKRFNDNVNSKKFEN